MSDLKDERVERQDFVMDTIQEAVHALLCDKNYNFPDREPIDLMCDIRDMIANYAVGHGIMTEEEFYPGDKPPVCKHSFVDRGPMAETEEECRICKLVRTKEENHCPHCGRDLVYAIVFSQATQKATVTEDMELIDYDDTEIGNTFRVQCYECGGNITNIVRE